MRYPVDRARISGWWGLPVGLCSVIAVQRLRYSAFNNQMAHLAHSCTPGMPGFPICSAYCGARPRRYSILLRPGCSFIDLG